MTDEIRTILLALAYAMEEGEVDAGRAASALRWLADRAREVMSGE